MTLTLPNIKRMVKLGARSLIDHKLRSFLTALGIIFGVSSVIAMLAIGEGASYEAREQIRAMGSTNIILRSRKPTQSASTTPTNQNLSVYGITYDDATRIRTLLPTVRVQVPARVIADFLRRGSVRLPGRIVGTVPWYLEDSQMTLLKGRFIAPADMEAVDNVVVLSDSAARELFPLDVPLGQTVFLGSQAYVVVGIVGQRGRPAAEAGKASEAKDVHEAFIPISAARARFGEVLVRRETGSFQAEQVELHELTLTTARDEDVLPVAEAVRSLLEHFHKDKDFEMIIPLELLKQAEATKRMFSIVLGSIAAISLLVGGIGIMNIMLASVTERTHEIGIRRALGATRKDIVLQFLAEALLLSLAGGLLGVALGLAVPAIVTQASGMKTIVRSDALVLAFGISMLTGVLFGLYPALRAAALNPIDALRHE
ncbi:MAG: FtsX-like permease family protein [Lentisphaerae bacterium]|nr:FtsX-like permease family protein [Lentisphaerota bacterium]